ncbi:hypothetical protein TCAL_15850 [Tigriopus californicus]|uniref:Uncharacterized protein n=1 Tax=Tigriopus californicus TaxID=6832 RepID=A0A553NQY0_TIGCA|nr:ankyrin repeat domain-containing protein 10-like isoform X2 [Tigriopus californicus]TRY67843.1 hypothetical protein TCAL_15850 [Tigriopus californicus]
MDSHPEDDNPSVPEGALLHRFIADGNDEKLMESIGRKVCLEIPSTFGLTPLQTACFKRKQRMVDILLESGALVNAKSLFTGKTAAHIAAFVGDVTVLEILTNYGAQDTDHIGNNILHEAVLGGHVKMIAHIMKVAPRLALGANRALRTPIHQAAFNNSSLEVVELVCAKGLDYRKLQDANGRTSHDLANLHSTTKWI